MVITGGSIESKRQICEALDSYFIKYKRIKSSSEIYFDDSEDAVPKKRFCSYYIPTLLTIEDEVKLTSNSKLLLGIKNEIDNISGLEPIFLTINTLIDDLTDECFDNLSENISIYLDKKLKIKFNPLDSKLIAKQSYFEDSNGDVLSSYSSNLSNKLFYMGVLEQLNYEANENRMYIFNMPEIGLTQEEKVKFKSVIDSIRKNHMVIVASDDFEFMDLDNIENINYLGSNQFIYEDIRAWYELNYPLEFRRDVFDFKFKWVIKNSWHKILSRPIISNYKSLDSDLCVEDSEMIFILLTYMRMNNLDFIHDLNDKEDSFTKFLNKYL